MSALTTPRFLLVFASLALGCLALVLVSGDAEARVPSVRWNSLAIGCGQLQDRYDAIMDDIKNNYDDMSQEEFNDLIHEASNIVTDWKAVCGVYGDINYVKRPLPKLGLQVIGNPTRVGATKTKSAVPATKNQSRQSSVLVKK
jgi:hypothetical protein